MTDNQRKKARSQMNEWLTLTGGRKTKAERVKKWREIVRDIVQDVERQKMERARRKVALANHKEYLEKFKEYR